MTTSMPPLAMRWRFLAAAAMLIALSLLGWVIAHWGWRWFGPAPVAIPLSAPPGDWARRIADARLFGAPSAREATETPSALGDLRLLGVFAERDGAGYALFRSGARGPMLVAAGSDLAPGLRLESVRPTGVTLLDAGVRREITLRPTTGREKPRPTVAAAPARTGSCAAPAGFAGSVVRINAELLSGMIGAPDTWKALLHADAGGLVVRDQSGFAGMMNLRSGDRVERANGVALAIPEDVASAVLSPLTKSQPVFVSGTREGKPQQWLYFNAGACPG